MSYDHKAIEKKWQDRWEAAGLFHASDTSDKPKFYCLIEFPYPSGAGLHIGHPRSYAGLDILVRKRRMEGYNVLYPIGWDAFGLPTETYAIKTGRAPQDVTTENIAIFKRQLQSLGISFDWSREISTTDPTYYKWTQWQFLQFFKAGLAYKATATINWCPKDKIGLANEEVVGGACERCGTPVEKREKEQWMLAITKYADRLLEDLETVDYLPKIKKQQIDWIGKSEGAEIKFQISNSKSETNTNDQISKSEISVFTTRPDTILGATFLVLAPEHEMVKKLADQIENLDEVQNYVTAASAQTDMERQNDEKEKTGVELKGIKAINPATGEEIPVWIADYVLVNYGTGAIMAVPQHDERDRAFAEKFGLPIVDAPLLDMDEAIEKTGGERATTYRLRDWVFSRQRYWGEPIPLVHCASGCSPETNNWVAVPDDQLPVTLPHVEKYEPTDDGESPLSQIPDWVNTTCPTCGGSAKRETDTMPNWAGSSWYFLAYAMHSQLGADLSPKLPTTNYELLKKWMPVDWYNGGMEHTTLHLLYSRFWNKFLFDQGIVPTSEPYAKRTSHGLIMAEDGTKMSKSKGNVVNPDDIVESHGADSLRVYEAFMGPFSEPVPWNTNGLVGVRRFLEKVVKFTSLIAETEPEIVTRALHQTIKKVTEDIEELRFNTAVAQLMIFGNTVQSAGAITKESFMTFLQLLCPFAPHLANELAQSFGHDGFLEASTWPVYDEALAKESEIEIAIQVNGKLRGTISVSADTDEATVVAHAQSDENVMKYLEGGIKKTIYVKGKLVNFVVL